MDFLLSHPGSVCSELVGWGLGVPGWSLGHLTLGPVGFRRSAALQEGLKRAVAVPLSLAETVATLWPALQELALCVNLACRSDLQVHGGPVGRLPCGQWWVRGYHSRSWAFPEPGHKHIPGRPRSDERPRFLSTEVGSQAAVIISVLCGTLVVSSLSLPMRCEGSEGGAHRGPRRCPPAPSLHPAGGSQSPGDGHVWCVFQRAHQPEGHQR